MGGKRGEARTGRGRQVRWKALCVWHREKGAPEGKGGVRLPSFTWLSISLSSGLQKGFRGCNFSVGCDNYHTKNKDLISHELMEFTTSSYETGINSLFYGLGCSAWPAQCGASSERECKSSRTTLHSDTGHGVLCSPVMGKVAVFGHSRASSAVIQREISKGVSSPLLFSSSFCGPCEK